jgi:hypothetical protein
MYCNQGARAFAAPLPACHRLQPVSRAAKFETISAATGSLGSSILISLSGATSDSVITSSSPANSASQAPRGIRVSSYSASRGSKPKGAPASGTGPTGSVLSPMSDTPSAAAVSCPTAPSMTIPSASWKRSTAACVLGPKSPSKPRALTLRPDLPAGASRDNPEHISGNGRCSAFASFHGGRIQHVAFFLCRHHQ